MIVFYFLLKKYFGCNFDVKDVKEEVKLECYTKEEKKGKRGKNIVKITTNDFSNVKISPDYDTDYYIFDFINSKNKHDWFLVPGYNMNHLLIIYGQYNRRITRSSIKHSLFECSLDEKLKKHFLKRIENYKVNEKIINQI
jgi:hypothetical protein